MAEIKKEETKSSTIDPWNYWLIGIFAFFLIFGGVMSGGGLLGVWNSEKTNSIETLEKNKQPFFSVARLIGQGNLTLGEPAISIKEVQVRNVPGGVILGLQKKLSEGRLMEGPVEQFGTLWWRVNFEDSPSGWVEFIALSSKIKTAKTLNAPYFLYNAYKPIGYILSLLLFIAVLILQFKLNREIAIAKNKIRAQDELAEKKKKAIQKDTREDLGVPSEEQYKNPRWEHIKELMKSKNQNDWRQAIIEADIILDEMLRRMSYKGLTIGDMLKQVEPSDFATLDKAWEAHKFRNEIAHTGSEFKLSKDEAERVISLFDAVFSEFYYV